MLEHLLLELQIQLLLLLLPGFVFLFLDPYPETLAIGNELRPVEIGARAHREIGFNGGANLTPRIPELPKRVCKVRLQVIKEVGDSAHTGLDILQPRLTVAEPSLRQAKVESCDIISRVHGKRFLQRLARFRVSPVEVLGLA